MILSKCLLIKGLKWLILAFKGFYVDFFVFVDFLVNIIILLEWLILSYLFEFPCILTVVLFLSSYF